ncbi:MAG TPA: glutathione S-transferase family protein [Candidatus Eisenbacteria bacterium]|nr:glutathione S-transferase family protein [Candidatus Eisenbacteria bacterium]
MVALYDSAISGNSYKVRLAAAQLGVPLEIRPVDILRGESRTPDFLRKNPNGRTPLLDDDGFLLAESNAILAYLARGTRLLPEDRRRWALVFQWLFFEQYSHEPYLATSRFWLLHRPESPERTAALAARRDGGWAALRVMEGHLAHRPFFVEDYTIADVALFAYTHVSHEGGFPLDDFPNVRAWLARVRAERGFVAM